jgi:hypothetical protein
LTRSSTVTSVETIDTPNTTQLVRLKSDQQYATERLYELLHTNTNINTANKATNTIDSLKTAPIGFTPIISFWKQIITIPEVREALYYEIYRQTHKMNGERLYDRYFSTLEQMVCTGRECYNVPLICIKNKNNKKRKIDNNTTQNTQQNSTIQPSQIHIYEHDKTYFESGFTFIEDFLDCLNSNILGMVLE